MKFLYARCSTKEQNEARQLEYAHELGLKDNQIFIDKASGKNANRPALKDMLSRLREGDEVYITELSRLGRSTKDLIDLMETFEQMHVEVHSKKEAIDTTTPAGKLIFHMLSAIAEFQRQIILENAAEGREAAMKQGVKFGRPNVDENALNMALYLFENDRTKSVKEICEKTGISRSTLYREAEKGGIKRINAAK